MKHSYLFIFLLFVVSLVNAQKIQDIASKNLTEAIPMFDHVSDFKNTDDIKLLGLGDVGVLAKESKRINMAFSAYLITKKNFRNVVISGDDWKLRPLNAYLNSSAPADTTKLISLILSGIPPSPEYANFEFIEFVKWLKQYNLDHPQDMVSILGATSNTPIAPSYFLGTYVYAIDKDYGQKLSEKWSENTTPDSLAYMDIKTWATGIKSAKLSKENQELLAKCNDDLLHNQSVVIIKSFDQKFPARVISDRSHYVANQIITKLNKKTIFLGLNHEVSKADLKENFSLNNVSVSSIGKYLDDRLKEKYCSLVTDFADTSSLQVLNYTARKMGFEVLTPSDKAKALYKKGDYLDRKKDKDLLKGYQPISLPYAKEIYVNILVNPGDYAADGVFIFKHLSEININLNF